MATAPDKNQTSQSNPKVQKSTKQDSGWQGPSSSEQVSVGYSKNVEIMQNEEH